MDKKKEILRWSRDASLPLLKEGGSSYATITSNAVFSKSSVAEITRKKFSGFNPLDMVWYIQDIWWTLI